MTYFDLTLVIFRSFWLIMFLIHGCIRTSGDLHDFCGTTLALLFCAQIIIYISRCRLAASVPPPCIIMCDSDQRHMFAIFLVKTIVIIFKSPKLCVVMALDGRESIISLIFTSSVIFVNNSTSIHHFTTTTTTSCRTSLLTFNCYRLGRKRRTR